MAELLSASPIQDASRARPRPHHVNRLGRPGGSFGIWDGGRKAQHLGMDAGRTRWIRPPTPVAQPRVRVGAVEPEKTVRSHWVRSRDGPPGDTEACG
eukprot:scaffold126_cov315-Pavlova_lutheri.AAC.1